MKHYTVSFWITFLLVTGLSAQGVLLEWDPNSESNLSGYKVYRSTSAGSGYSLLNKTGLLGTAAYSDSDVVAGNTYFYRVSAVNTTGQESGYSNEVAVSVPRANQSPVSDAGPDQTVREKSLVTLSGSGYDPDGGTLSYEWSQISGPPVIITGKNQPQCTFQAPSLDLDAVLIFELTVSDDTGSMASDQMTVTVVANRAPVISLVSTRAVSFGEQVQLSASASDPDGDLMSYQWSQISGTAVQLAGDDTLSPSFQAPDQEETLIFQLVVSDGDLASDSTTSVIVSDPNQPPVADAGSAQSVKEGKTVTLSGSGSDPDGDVLSYRWIQISGPAVAMQDSTQPKATFETPRVEANTDLVFELTVSDGRGAEDSDQTVVTVKNNRKPSVSTDDSMTARPGQRVTLDATAVDPDGDPLTYSWTQISGTSVELSGAGNLSASFTAPEQEGSLMFMFSAYDGELGAQTQTEVIVALQNQDPTSDAGGNQTVREARLVTLSGSGSDPDGDPLTFLWEQTGGPAVALSDAMQARVDFTAPFINQDTRLDFRLTVQDGKGGQASNSVSVHVTNNSRPEVNVSGQKPIKAGDVGFLSADVADSDGDVLTYRWTQVSGTKAKIEEPLQPSTEFRAPLVSSHETATFRLTVSDDLDSTSAEVDVKVLKMNKDSFLVPATVNTGSLGFEDMFVGVAITNTLPVFNAPVSSAVDATGFSVEQGELEALPPSGQRTFITDELAQEHQGAASLLTDGFDGPLQGFFMIGDWKLNRLDGIGSVLESSRKLIFPMARRSDVEDMLLYLFNPEEEPAELSLQLFDRRGVLKNEVASALAPSGTLMGTLGQIFEPLLTTEDGYLEVNSDVPLKGFELYANDRGLATIAGRPAAKTSELFIPHFFVARDGGTELRLMSSEQEETTEVTIRAFGNNSDLIGTFTTAIAPGELFVGSVETIFELTPSEEPISGHLALEVSAGGVGHAAELSGLVLFTGNDGNFVSSLPVVSQGESETLFLHVAQSAGSGIYTGLAILNSNDEAAEVEIEIFDEDGNKTDATHLVLAAGERAVDLLDGSTYFGAGFDQLNGHFRVTSSVPVISFALFGDYGMEFLSAIEGQPAKKSRK